MRPNVRRNLALLLVLVAFAAALTWYLNVDRTPPAAPIVTQEDAGKAEWQQEGPMTPDAPLVFIDDTRSNLRNYAGKPILLHFWATWCPPCVAELPDMMQLAAKRPEITFVTVTVDTEREALEDFIRMSYQHAHLATLPPNFLIAVDPDQTLSMEIFQTMQLPETILINTHNRMVDKIAGPAEDWLSPEMATRLDALTIKSDAKQ